MVTDGRPVMRKWMKREVRDGCERRRVYIEKDSLNFSGADPLAGRQASKQASKQAGRQAGR